MRRNFYVISAAAIVVLAIAGIAGWQRMTASAASAAARTQTSPVQRGNLVATVNAAGNISAPSIAALAFQTSGRVAKVGVQVGEPVKKGQLLIQLDTADLQLALKTAQSNVSSSQASYDASQVSLQSALKTAQANLVSAQANYDAAKAKNATNPEQLVVAKSALDKASIALQTAQANYNAVAWRGDVSASPQAAALASATDDYNSALANFKITAAGINDSALRSAEASLDNAKTSLDQAQKNIETQTRTSQANFDNAKTALDQAQRNLDKATLTSPFDGIVATLNLNPGDMAGNAVAVSVVDLSNLQVKTTIAEVDVAKIKVGQTAQMTVDAIPTKTYNAQVMSVSPVGTITQGVVNYTVVTVLTNPDLDVKPGMTANLAITVDRRDNVLLVPNRAVRTQGNQKTVTVLYKDQNIQVPITTGLSNDTSIEVTTGLQEGDLVVLNQTQTQGSARGLGVGGGAGFMLGGPR